MERAGGVVRADPAPPTEDWDAAELAGLVEEARLWQRVGRAAAPPEGEFLAGIVAGLFGMHGEGAGGRLLVSPWIVPEWKAYALRRVRAHRTLVDVEVRPRAEWVTVRLALPFGPAVAAALSLRNAGPVSRVTVDEVPLEGPRAIFTAAGEHEAVFFLATAR